FAPSQSPSAAHLFGTDELGRDVLSRVIYGSRVSVPIALLMVSLAALIGGLVGALAGYFRGLVDGFSMRLVDLVFAFPPIILAMVVAAVLGRRLRNAALAIVGLGAQPPKAEWGSMVADGAQYFQWWWIGTFPGLAIFTAVLAFNFLGDSLRDLFDPRTSWGGGERE